MNYDLQTLCRLCLLLLAVVCLGSSRSMETVTDRDAYNQGTAKLTEGDLASAEMLLYSAVAGNNDRVQPTALYNLGLARFGGQCVVQRANAQGLAAPTFHAHVGGRCRILADQDCSQARGLVPGFHEGARSRGRSYPCSCFGVR